MMHSENALRDTLVAAKWFDEMLQMNLYHKLMGLYSRKISGYLLSTLNESHRIVVE